jgi:hypothetical protein
VGRNEIRNQKFEGLAARDPRFVSDCHAGMGTRVIYDQALSDF